MFSLTTADFASLRGKGGEQFVHFVDRLIRAEAARGGLPQSEIKTQLRVNIRDGGVDTEVRASIPRDQSGWFGVATCWQFKAVDAASIDSKPKKSRKRNDLQQEVHKPHAKQLIQQGYGYRFCLLGDLTPADAHSWESKLSAEVRAINPQGVGPRVISGGDLLAWAERFPAIVAWLRNSTQQVLHWEAWRTNCRAVTRTYVANPAWESIAQQIRQHADIGVPPIEGVPCFVIGGAAGVGKTRLVFEALHALPQAPALVVYAPDENDARKLATELANTEALTAIVVADECSIRAQCFLNEHLRGHTDRIRFFCLDNTGERFAAETSQVWLSADALSNTVAILNANFEQVPADRRRQYAEISKGFVRLAADMCQRDAEIAAGDMSRLLSSVEQYVRHRLRDNKLALVSLLALFHKLGAREGVKEELSAVCQMTGCSAQEVLATVRAVKASPGFVVEAGRYVYVTPDIVARILFAEGWKTWVASEPAQFLTGLPPHLMSQLVERAGTLGGEEVRAQVASFFRHWFQGLNAAKLADSATTALAAAIVETTPNIYLPFLRAMLEEAAIDELHAIAGHRDLGRLGPRRTLVWLLERLASFPEFFADCEGCLFRLALAENEPQIGNNATGAWRALFNPFLSGTATPFPVRLPILKLRTASIHAPELRLAFQGVASVLTRPHGRPIGPPVAAGRLRPRDWHPSSYMEEVECYRGALSLCSEALEAGRPEQRELAIDVILGNLLYLIHRGLADELAAILRPKTLNEQEARRLVNQVERFVSMQVQTGRATRNEMAARQLRTIQDWIDTFRPLDFGGRLRSVCAREAWDTRFVTNPQIEQDDTVELAAQVILDPSLLVGHLGWLATPEARAADRFGFTLGTQDGDFRCARMLFQQAIDLGTPPLLRGYVRGMVNAARKPNSEVRELMSLLESKRPELAIDVLTCGGDSFDGFDSIVRLVRQRIVSPKYLVALAMGIGRRELNGDELRTVLALFKQAAADGDEIAALAGLHFLSVYALFERSRSRPGFLESADIVATAWDLIEMSLPSVTGESAAEWAEIIKGLAKDDPVRAARAWSRGLLSEHLDLVDLANMHLAELARDRPEDVMVAVGDALLDSDLGWRIQLVDVRPLVSQIPPNVVLGWARRHGLRAARAIAAQLPRPYIDDAGKPVVPEVLDDILSEYDDPVVRENFMMGAYKVESWWGNGAAMFRQQAEVARKFLNHPNPGVRAWAKQEIADRERMAEMEERQAQEADLPG